MDEKFRKSNRITKSLDFQRVYNEGKKYSNYLSVVYILQKENEGTPPRLGLTVSSKMGNAVVRNRIKRITREAFRKNKHTIINDVDVVFHSRRKIAEATYQELEQAFLKLLHEAGVLSE